MVFAPYCRAEAEPDLRGNVEMTDCETGRKRTQHVNDDLFARYLRSYGRHFEMWKEHARRYAVVTARVPAEASFHDALRADALPAGAIELTH